MACISRFQFRMPGRIRTAIDNAKYHYWKRFQNGNAQLQAMAGQVAILRDELQTAYECLSDPDRDHSDLESARGLLQSALDTTNDLHKAIGERL